MNGGKWLLVKKDIYDYNMRDVIKWSRDLASTYYKLCMYLTEHDDYLCYKTSYILPYSSLYFNGIGIEIDFIDDMIDAKIITKISDEDLFMLCTGSLASLLEFKKEDHQGGDDPEHTIIIGGFSEGKTLDLSDVIHPIGNDHKDDSQVLESIGDENDMIDAGGTDTPILEKVPDDIDPADEDEIDIDDDEQYSDDPLAFEETKIIEKIAEEVLDKGHDDSSENNLSNEPTDIEEDDDEEDVWLPPTIEEIAEYVTEKKYETDPKRFYDFYAARKWIDNKERISDFRPLVDKWENDQAYKKPELDKYGPNFKTEQISGKGYKSFLNAFKK